MTRGKVVLVPFPFDDLSSTKVRPAVCLTEPIGEHRHVVLAFVTSRVAEDRLETDLVLTPDVSGFASTGLRVASTVRLHRLMTVGPALLSRELGCLTPDLLGAVETRLRALFGLA
jgi:mRNA interferase MazF